MVGVVIAEFTGANRGLGFIIINASYYLNSPLMFAAILLISVLGVVFYATISLIERFFLKHHY
ncbi:hypothetical protein KKE06_02110 [Candidatus Micrarchaeota archaeon]|nr:hypothetical protein [Candidatus Micrarchaeota archaeon]MBU1929975.1 hypothetical protein [Candidatus Micrarchaeota archaeon]